MEGRLECDEFLWDIEAAGAFIASTITVHESEHPISIIKDLAIKMGRPSASDGKYYTIKTLEDIYRLSLRPHEYRHFHDFIESPVALPILYTAVRKWEMTINLLWKMDADNITPVLPLRKHLQNIREKLGTEVDREVEELMRICRFEAAHLAAIPALSQNGTNGTEENVLRIVQVPLLDNFSFTAPVYVISGLVIPINLVTVMEGSAVLSQIIWTHSTLGSEAASRLWSQIRLNAEQAGKYHYTICLRMLESTFGERWTVDLDKAMLFRRIFRYAMSGFLPEGGAEGVDINELILDSPSGRFALLMSRLNDEKLQSQFSQDPETILKDQSQSSSNRRRQEIENILQNEIQRLRNLSKSNVLPLHGQCYLKLLETHMRGLHENIDTIDHYLDILWATDDFQELAEPPIQIFRLEKDKPPIFHITDQQDAHLWQFAYTLDEVIHQALYYDSIRCPMSGMRDSCTSDKAVWTKGTAWGCGQKCITKLCLELARLDR